eukprot:SAG11_NODE_27_length_23309_cov_10.579362_1_plen_328_part_00
MDEMEDLRAENAELHAENKRLRRKARTALASGGADQARELEELRDTVAALREQRQDYLDEIDELKRAGAAASTVGEGVWRERAEAAEAETKALEGELTRLETELDKARHAARHGGGGGSGAGAAREKAENQRLRAALAAAQRRARPPRTPRRPSPPTPTPRSGANGGSSAEGDAEALAEAKARTVALEEQLHSLHLFGILNLDPTIAPRAAPSQRSGDRSGAAGGEDVRRLQQDVDRLNGAQHGQQQKRLSHQNCNGCHAAARATQARLMKWSASSTSRRHGCWRSSRRSVHATNLTTAASNARGRRAVQCNLELDPPVRGSGGTAP